jgi:integrase
VVEAFKLRREQQEFDRVEAGKFWEDWDLVFTTHVGTPLFPRNDHREFRRIVAATGQRRARFHDLRHKAASPMLAAGVNPRVVMEVFGHSQISVTMNTYSHVSTSTATDAVGMVEDALRDGPDDSDHQA